MVNSQADKENNYIKDKNGIWWFTDKNGNKYFADKSGNYHAETEYKIIYPQFSNTKNGKKESVNAYTDKPLSVSILTTFYTVFAPLVLISTIFATVVIVFGSSMLYSFIPSIARALSLTSTSNIINIQLITIKLILGIGLAATKTIFICLFVAELNSKKISAFDKLITLEIINFSYTLLICLIDLNSISAGLSFLILILNAVYTIVIIYIIIVLGRINTLNYNWYKLNIGQSIWQYSKYFKVLNKVDSKIWMPKTQ
ncbi:MAG: hypothetical protein LBT91_00380 [Bifidobacteriaceae bacterium]|jgi:hypothetical protein|nr:hypothetical protein [Bifidobacteriaceae bacterium]